MAQTHLIDWLRDGYTHCQNGTRKWCEMYLNDAAVEIERLRVERDKAISLLRERNYRKTKNFLAALKQE